MNSFEVIRARILLLIDALVSGGAERQLCGLAIELKKHGHDVRLVSFYDEYGNFYSDYFRDDGVKAEIISKGRNPFSRINVIRMLANTYKPI